MAANDKTGVGAGRPDWQTPPEIIRALDRKYALSFDAFASHKNALLPEYATADGLFRKPIHGGPPVETEPGDGLTASWFGRRVFMNPPYSRGFIGRAVAKAYAERIKAQIIVALLPASTDTQWFQWYILPHCDITWLPRRIKFIDPATGQPGASPPSGSIIAVFRSEFM